MYYEPTPTKVFLEIVGRLAIRYEDFAFYDFGSGMGGTLLLASTFPFREIVGIEFSETLHRRAVENIGIYKDPARRCSAIKSICMDAPRSSLGPSHRRAWISAPPAQPAHPARL